MGNLVLGKRKLDNKNIELTERDRFGHMLIIGPTRCGKTSKIIKPCIWQDLIDIKLKKIKNEILVNKINEETNKKIDKIKLKNISKDKKLEKIEILLDKRNKKFAEINPQNYIAGLTVIEPKGDLAEDVVSMCNELKLPYIYINPLDEKTHRFNIMQGDPDIVAESNRTVLRNLFGRQEAFFAQVQETTARNTMLLMKRVLGDEIDLIDVARALRDADILKRYLDDYERKVGSDDLSQFFRGEVFGSLKDKYYQFALGLRQQLEDIGGNNYLKRVLIGKSDIDLDKHLAEGGILIVNTAMGHLGKLGDVFGAFIVMHLQNAVFRRPGNEWTRPYHYLWVDEAPRYLNPDTERLLAIGGSFRCSTNMAVQSTSQLEYESNRNFANTVRTNCRTKILFGGLEAVEAKLFESDMGADEKNIKLFNYNYNKLLPMPPLLPRGYKVDRRPINRFTYTDIIELKSWQKEAEALVRYYVDGAIQKPEKVIVKVGKYKKPFRVKFLESRLNKRFKNVLISYAKKISYNYSMLKKFLNDINDRKESVLAKVNSIFKPININEKKDKDLNKKHPYYFSNTSFTKEETKTNKSKLLFEDKYNLSLKEVNNNNEKLDGINKENESVEKVVLKDKSIEATLKPKEQELIANKGKTEEVDENKEKNKTLKKTEDVKKETANDDDWWGPIK